MVRPCEPMQESGRPPRALAQRGMGECGRRPEGRSQTQGKKGTAVPQDGRQVSTS